jgi:cytochrome c peroxidase
LRHLIAGFCCVVALSACVWRESVDPSAREDLDQRVEEHRQLHRLPESHQRRFGEAQALLGEKLFSDVRLSENQQVSCASCHDPDNQFRDRTLPRSSGVRGAARTQAPPFWGIHLRQPSEASGATGRDRYISEDLFDILENPASMGADLRDVRSLVSQDQPYRDLYAAAYPRAVTPVRIEKIVEALEAYIVDVAAHPKPSRFDAWANGQSDAMSSREIRGYRTFVELCSSCHYGPYFNGRLAGDNTAQRKHIGFKNIGLSGNFEGLLQWTSDIRDYKRTRIASVRELGCANGLFSTRQALTVYDAVKFYDSRFGDQDAFRNDVSPRINFDNDEAEVITEFLLNALSTKGPNDCVREIFPR